MIDLHTHSCYSDGRPTPAELVERVRELGLTAFAVTDHNTGRGAREALPLAREQGLKMVPGIEWYVRWERYAGVIDLLSYGLDLWDPSVRRAERAALTDLEDQIAECCGYLTEMGYPVTIGEVRAENPCFAGHVQVGHALAHKGLIPDRSAMDPLFQATWPRVRPPDLEMGQAIDLIHRAGGVAVLAHPHQYKRDGANWPAEDMAALSALGLDGVEVYHRRMGPADRAHFGEIAAAEGLLVTGGSDEHGWPAGFPYMGVEAIPDSILIVLQDRLGSPSAARTGLEQAASL